LIDGKNKSSGRGHCQKLDQQTETAYAFEVRTCRHGVRKTQAKITILRNGQIRLWGISTRRDLHFGGCCGRACSLYCNDESEPFGNNVRVQDKLYAACCKAVFDGSWEIDKRN
jgi:hypothetical protein